MQLKYALVTAVHLDNTWPLLCPWIVQAMGEDVTQDCVDGIRADIMRGTSQLWTIQKLDNTIMAVAITEAMLVAGRRVLVVRWASGQMANQWIEDIGIIERWAMIQGFERVEVWGRPGWSKLLKPHGYRESFRVLTKSVDREVH